MVIWEQTATCATYSINWLVFITEMKSVYSAVRTGSLNIAVCASSLNGYLRTNSDLCHLQHKLIGFYNRVEKCLQRGTEWVFKYSGLRFGCKGLMVLSLTACILLTGFILSLIADQDSSVTTVTGLHDELPRTVVQCPAQVNNSVLFRPFRLALELT